MLFVFINMFNMNSYMLYFITGRKIGDWRVNSKKYLILWRLTIATSINFLLPKKFLKAFPVNLSSFLGILKK